MSPLLLTTTWLALTLSADVAPSKKADSRAPVVVTPQALELHKSAIVIDGHNDLPYQVRTKANLSVEALDIRKPQPTLHTDIPRLKTGGLGAQFWSAYVDADTMDTKDAVVQTMEQIDIIHRIIEQYPDVFELASTADDIERIWRSGKIASLIGVEGGHSIQGSLGVLRLYHKLGVRYMTLTHSRTLDWADSATDDPKSDGLSPFGEQVVREMNRLGMLVDISHVSVATMEDALRISRAPVIASHSSAYAIAQHPRNVPDEILLKVKENGGVIMINFYPGFIVPEGARLMREMFAVGRELKKKYPDPKQFEDAMAKWRAERPYPLGSVHTVLDHIEHVVKIAGVDHVGLGSDYDGISYVPKQLEDVSTYPYITQGLLDRGHSPDDIRKILGTNLLRVLRKAEDVARK